LRPGLACGGASPIEGGDLEWGIMVGGGGSFMAVLGDAEDSWLLSLGRRLWCSDRRLWAFALRLIALWWKRCGSLLKFGAG
jgi:hypothetical protein